MGHRIRCPLCFGVWGRGCPDSQKLHPTAEVSLGRKGLVSSFGGGGRRKSDVIFGHGLARVGGHRGTQFGQLSPDRRRGRKLGLSKASLLPSRRSRPSVYPVWSRPRSHRYKNDLGLQNAPSARVVRSGPRRPWSRRR